VFGAIYGATRGGYLNMHTLLAELGLNGLETASSLIVLGLTGAWIYQHRRADIWLLACVAAIVARVWTYHRVYDDGIVLFGFVFLARLARHFGAADLRGILAGLVVVFLWVASLAPARMLVLDDPWPSLFAGLQTAAWLLIAVAVVLARGQTPSPGALRSGRASIFP